MNIINTKNLKKDFQDPDLKAYGNKMPVVNKKVMQAGAIFNRMKGKVIDKTSDVISAPKRAVEGAKTRGDDRQYKAYKMVNDSKGVRDKGNETDPLFRARNMMKTAQKKAMEALMSD